VGTHFILFGDVESFLNLKLRTLKQVGDSIHKPYSQSEVKFNTARQALWVLPSVIIDMSYCGHKPRQFRAS